MYSTFAASIDRITLALANVSIITQKQKQKITIIYAKDVVQWKFHKTCSMVSTYKQQPPPPLKQKKKKEEKIQRGGGRIQHCTLRE